MKRYGYHRTSTREQHLDRGIKEMLWSSFFVTLVT